MRHWKICVYAIAKNEEKFVDRWVDSMSEADCICVLDTGSTDNTVELLKNRGIIVQETRIEPWRFDVARNESMKLVPRSMDICVSVDLDEVFEPGWANAIRRKWTKKSSLMLYYLIASHLPNGQEEASCFVRKIHKNEPKAFKWIHAIHEELIPLIECEDVLIPEVRDHHYPDPSKSRSFYLDMMREGYKQNPSDMRNAFVFARDFFMRDHPLFIEYMENFVKRATPEMVFEKAFGLGMLGYTYLLLEDPIKAKKSFFDSINTSDVFRMPILGYAICLAKEDNPEEAIIYIKKALEIKTKFTYYPDENTSWREKPYILLHDCYLCLGEYDNALLAINKALEYRPDEKILAVKENLIKIMNEQKGS